MLGYWRRLLILGMLSLIAAPIGAQQFGELNARPYSTRDHYRVRPIAFQFLGTPANNAIIGVFQNQGPPIAFPPLLTSLQQGPVLYSSGATCGTAGSSTSAYLLRIGGTTQCTVTLQTTCSSAPGASAIAVTGCTTPWVLATGKTLSLIAPGTVNGEANLGFTIMGYYP